MNHDTSKLPRWAREAILDLQRKLADTELELERTRRVHALTENRRSWALIQGPPAGSVEPPDTYRLFYLSAAGARPACSLGRGDVLVIGRAQLSDDDGGIEK